MEISRFPCKRLLRMPGSTTTRGRHVSRDIDTRRVAFCGTENIGTPNLSYAAQYLACALPCERFTSALADNPCITRGRYGSLNLHRDGLPPSTFCRSPGAPVHSIKSGKPPTEHKSSAVHPTTDIHFEFQSRSRGQNPVFRGWVFRNLSMNCSCVSKFS